MNMMAVFTEAFMCVHPSFEFCAVNLIGHVTKEKCSADRILMGRVFEIPASVKMYSLTVNPTDGAVEQFLWLKNVEHVPAIGCLWSLL